MALSFVAAGTGVTGTAASTTVGYPAGVTDGDVVFLVIDITGSRTVGAISGWTQVNGTDYHNGTSDTLSIWRQVFATGNSSPAPSWGSSASFAARTYAYRGANTSSPIGALGTVSTGTTSPATSTGITSLASNSFAVLFQGQESSTAQGTPTSWNSRGNTAAGTAGFGVWDLALGAAGSASGSTSASSGIVWITVQLELQVAVAAANTLGWITPLSEPVRRKSDHAGQPVGDVLIEQPLPPFFPFGWYMPLTDPTRRKSDHAGQPQGYFPTLPMPPFLPFGWHMPLSEPVRRKSNHAGQPQGYTFYALNLQPPPVDYGPFFYANLSEPVRRKSDHAGQPGGNFVPPLPMPPFQPFGWYKPLDEPTRRKSDHALQPQGFFPTAAFQNFYPYGWFARLNEPTRRVSDHAGQPQGYFPALPMPPFLPFGWHMPLSEPVRRKSDHAGQPGGFYFPTVPVPVVFGSFFYGALAEPVRRKSDHAGQPGGIYFPPLPAPPLAPHGWFKPLNEPVRRKSDHALQPQGFFPPSKYFFIQPYIVTPVQGFTFPIPLFREITLHNLADQLNTLIDEINLALQGQGMCGGDPSVATVRQFVTALNQQGVWSALWTALLLLPVGDPAVMEFRAAQTMRKHGPLYEYAKAISGYSTIQMDVLWTLATGLTP